MNLYNVVGAPGMGKSEFAKKLIAGRRCLVFDVQNEYGARTKYPGQVPLMLSINNRDARSRVIPPNLNVKKFIELCKSKQDTICVFEESTGFFKGGLQRETSQLILSRMHSRNIYLFLWHSINRVPPEFMELSNYVVLYKTNDQRGNVDRKFKKLLEAYDYLQTQPNGKNLVIDNFQL